jgi:hypothetical protein
MSSNSLYGGTSVEFGDYGPPPKRVHASSFMQGRHSGLDVLTSPRKPVTSSKREAINKDQAVALKDNLMRAAMVLASFSNSDVKVNIEGKTYIAKSKRNILSANSDDFSNHPGWGSLEKGPFNLNVLDAKVEDKPDGSVHIDGEWPYAGRWSDYGTDYPQFDDLSGSNDHDETIHEAKYNELKPHLEKAFPDYTISNHYLEDGSYGFDAKKKNTKTSKQIHEDNLISRYDQQKNHLGASRRKLVASKQILASFERVGKHTLVNKATRELWQISADGKNIECLYHPDDEPLEESEV